MENRGKNRDPGRGVPKRELTDRPRLKNGRLTRRIHSTYFSVTPRKRSRFDRAGIVLDSCLR